MKSRWNTDFHDAKDGSIQRLLKNLWGQSLHQINRGFTSEPFRLRVIPDGSSYDFARVFSGLLAQGRRLFGFPPRICVTSATAAYLNCNADLLSGK